MTNGTKYGIIITERKREVHTMAQYKVTFKKTNFYTKETTTISLGVFDNPFEADTVKEIYEEEFGHRGCVKIETIEG